MRFCFCFLDSAKSGDEDDEEEDDDEEDNRSNKENISNSFVPLPNGEPTTVCNSINSLNDFF
jgi:hypothetical protein